MSSKKKIVTSAVALGTAAALTLGGTFAWQSISQRALNEKSNIVNPGGRLHDDFDGTNKDVYVENFANEDIFARIRLSEYFEIIMNYNVEGAEVVDELIGSKDESGNFTYEVFRGYDNIENGVVSAGVRTPAEGEESPDTYAWWSWTMGGESSGDAYYMPTFNLNKDSLVADINGIYEEGNVGTISSETATHKQYTDYNEWTADSTAIGWEIYDADSNTVDELKDWSKVQDIITNGTDSEYYNAVADAITLVGGEVEGSKATHTAQAIAASKGLISMDAWLSILETAPADTPYAAEGRLTDAGKAAMYGYWVYDEDGWVYWSAPIESGKTTGRLLDAISLNQVMDDTWYYAIEVEGQFVTANDVGKGEDTGFYQYADEAPGEDAETLLKLIGVTIPEDAYNPITMQIDVNTDTTWYFPNENTLGKTVTLEATSATIYDYSKGWGEDGFQTDVPASELANIQWSMSGNTSADTVLNSTSGATTTLTIASDETASITVTAKLTYNEVKGEGSAYITNEPYAITSQIFHQNGSVLSGRDYYEAGKDNGYEYLFFPVYYSSVYEYSREEAHTGTAHDYLAKGMSWKLGHVENYQFVEDESIEGVTLKQNESDPSKVTLTVEAGYNKIFAFGVALSDSDQVVSYIQLLPKVAGISLSWPDGVTDDGTNVTMSLSGTETIKPTADYSEESGNESVERYGCSFYAEDVTLPSGYKALRYDDDWYICDADCDKEYGIDLEENEKLITISGNDGSVTINQELEGKINFSYKMIVWCDGYQITRNVSVSAGTSSTEGGAD